MNHTHLDISGNSLRMFTCMEATGVYDLQPYPFLTSLKADYNKITSFIINIPSTLKRLTCRYGRVQNLDNLPEGLESLECDYNRIQSLDYLPSSLKYLSCFKNEIEHLDCLPTNLEELRCGCNPLKELDHLPEQLKSLNCYHVTSLEYVDHLPASLHTLICRNTTIKDLCFLPSTIKSILFEEKNNEKSFWKRVADLTRLFGLQRSECFVDQGAKKVILHVSSIKKQIILTRK